MAKAIDIGTSFIVGAEMRDGKEVFTKERNAFFRMEREDFAEEMLSDAGARFLIRDDHLYVVGEDALRFATITGDQSAYRRPMARGVLNPGEEEAISMLETLIEGILGKASYEGEVCAATVPAAPVDAEGDTTFHRIVVERCLRRLGYEPRLLNEALAIIYHENPSAGEGLDATPFTGLGLSFGAGMTNAVLAWRAKKLFEMAIARGGDWIDERVALARATSRSKVCARKERKLDLERVPRSDGLLMALEIYHDDLIAYVVRTLREALANNRAEIDAPIEVCVAGGTSKVPGFVGRLERALLEGGLPFEIARVRHAADPLHAVAAGALVAAVSHERRNEGKRTAPNAGAVKKAAGRNGGEGANVDRGRSGDSERTRTRTPAANAGLSRP